MVESIPNLYVHFPFCRRRCTYCVLFSRVGKSAADREAYVKGVARDIRREAKGIFKTVYFGGGSPGMCELKEVFAALESHLDDASEFTVELHPEDVTKEKLSELKSGGVNRISMGVQSLNDEVLKSMNRAYTADQAESAFMKVRDVFENTGVDIIVGFPGDKCDDYSRLEKWNPAHCSVYALQNERKLQNVPSDEWMLDRVAEMAAFLSSIGLKRYEISNYAREGYECRHNLATWRGEDYLGLGEGAFGRVGLERTQSGKVVETVTRERDEIERTIFRLRTREGLVAGVRDEWRGVLERFEREGLLEKNGDVFRLTERGSEVCDTILAELVI